MNDRHRLPMSLAWLTPLGVIGSRNRIRLTDPLQNHHHVFRRLPDPGALPRKHPQVRQLAADLSESKVNNNKYLIGLIGLAVGFIISFFLTQNYNRSNAAPAATGMGSGMAAAPGGAGSQQAMMGQVQQVIERAKNGPNDFQAQVEAAKVFNQIGRVAETAEYLKKAYDIDPNKFNELRAAGFLGQYYFDQKDYAEAETWFNRAIKADPKDADLHVALAETFVQREPPQPDQAVVQLQQALTLDEKNGHALGHLIEAYALKRDARGAEETIKRLKETDPTNQRLSVLEKLVADLKAGKAVTIPKE